MIEGGVEVQVCHAEGAVLAPDVDVVGTPRNQSVSLRMRPVDAAIKLPQPSPGQQNAHAADGMPRTR